MAKNLPIVALVGPTNAGKSSLLNRLARRRVAIVAREEGTTRDSVSARIDDAFLLLDTAGLKKPEDDFELSIQDQIADAVDAAQIILLTLDSSQYFNHAARQIARTALRSGKPVFLVLNKSDLGEALPITEFRALGIAPEQILRTSATTGAGVDELKAAILQTLDTLPVNSHDARGKMTEPDLKIALIGRPNVGKSSLFNALAQKQQAIVSSRQGTTRDINRVQVRYNGQTLEILDTAGLRRPGKREVGIEKFSALRSLAAIEEADVCALLIDATEPHAKLDQSLAGQIVEAGKGIIVVLTKTDLVKGRGDGAQSASDTRDANGAQSTGDTRNANSTQKTNPGSAPNTRGAHDAVAATSTKSLEEIVAGLEYDLNFIPYAPVLFTSSETGKNVTQLFALAEQTQATRQQVIPTTELNKILNEATSEHPPAGLKNTKPRPKYMVQTDVCPPWFVVHGHALGTLHWSYKRFLERKIREKYPFAGTPIKFSWRSDGGGRDRLRPRQEIQPGAGRQMRPETRRQTHSRKNEGAR